MLYQTVTLKNAPKLARVVRAADPAYRKRDATLHAQDSVELTGTYWDGGSRATYTAVDMLTGCVSVAEQFAPPQFGGPRAAPSVVIPRGVAIVRTGIFCGKPARASVYVNPADVTPLLPAA